MFKLNLSKLNFLTVLATEIDLPLAPCANGLVKVDSSVTFEEILFDVKKVYCDIGKRTAMVEIVRKDNEYISTRLPALLVSRDEDVKTDAFDMPDVVNDVQRLFMVYAAIKRAIGISSRSKSNNTFNLLPATSTVRKIVGLIKENVVCVEKFILFRKIYYICSNV